MLAYLTTNSENYSVPGSIIHPFCKSEACDSERLIIAKLKSSPGQGQNHIVQFPSATCDKLLNPHICVFVIFFVPVTKYLERKDFFGLVVLQASAVNAWWPTLEQNKKAVDSSLHHGRQAEKQEC